MKLQKHWSAIIGIFLSLLYIILQIVQWKRHGDDLTGVAIIGVLSGVLVLVIFRYWKVGGDRVESLRAQITTLKDEHETQIRHLQSQLKQAQDWPAEVREVPARIRDQEADTLELVGKLKLLSAEAKRLAGQLLSLSDMAQRTHGSLGSGPFDRSYTSLATINPLMASFVDWQSQVMRYVEMMRELNQPVNQRRDITFQFCWNCLDQESKNLAQQADSLRSSACTAARR